MPNRRYNKQVANQMKAGGKVKKMGGRSGEMMYSRGYGVDEKSKRKPKKQKPTDNALDMKGTSIFGGPALKR